MYIFLVSFHIRLFVCLSFYFSFTIVFSLLYLVNKRIHVSSLLNLGGIESCALEQVGLDLSPCSPELISADGWSTEMLR